MYIIRTGKVIERLLILHNELSMQRDKQNSHVRHIQVDPDLLILDVLIAIFGHRKGKALWKEHLTGI